MKFVRVVLIALALLVGGSVVLVALAFNSSIQTWAARRALASEPSLHASVGRVSVGIDQVRLDELRIERRGVVLTVPVLEAELPPISAGLNRQIYVRKLVAKGWTLDLTRAGKGALTGILSGSSRVSYEDLIPSLLSTARADSPTYPAPATVEPFAGIFAQMRLPVDASLDGVDLEGDVLLPPAPGTAGIVRAHVLVGGGGLAAGSEGRFTFNVSVALPGDAGPVSALTAEGTVSAAMQGPRGFRRIESRINAAAKGAKFPLGVRLAAELSAARSASGETYTATLAGDSKELASLQGDFSDSTHRLAGKWKLDVTDDDVSPFALGRVLPLFDVVGSGRFETDATLAQTRVSGGLNMTADRLTAIRPELSPIGAVKLTADFDLTHRGGLLRVDHLRATLAGGRPILTVQGLQPFAFNVDTGELQVADSSRDLVGLTLQGVPIEWAEPFLPDTILTGDPVRGEFSASASGGGLTLKSRAPLALIGLTATQAGRVIVHDVAVSVDAEADYTPKGWQVQLIGKADGRHPQFDADGSALPPPVAFTLRCGRLAGAGQEVKATGELNADIAAVLVQSGWRAGPGAGSPLAKGQLAGDFTASLGAKRSIEANFQLSGLAADPVVTSDALPDIAGSLRIDLAQGGKVSFVAPVVIALENRKSDLTVTGAFSKSGNATAFEGQVASARLVAADLKVLGALFAPAPKPDTDPSALPARPPALAFWGGALGRLQLALKRVEFSNFTASDVGGTLVVDPVSLKASALHALLAPGGDCQIDGSIAFSPAAQAPYALQATVDVNNFDPAPLFKVLKPAQAPMVEGKFSLHAQLTGQGMDIASLGDRIRGSGQITSKGGVFRMLSTDISPKSQNAGKVAVIESFLGSMASVITRHKDVANKVQAVIDLAKTISPIQFDQMRLGITRDGDLNTILKDFALISPEMRLGGEGKVTYQAGTAILDQPFSMKLKLSARGHTGDLLKTAGMLEAAPDEFGYIGCTLPITIGGTLAKPDTSDLQAALLKTAYEKSGASDWLGKLLP